MSERNMKQKRTNLTPAVPGQGNGYWVHIPTLDKIRRDCPEPKNPLGVFVALNHIASDEHSASFRVAFAYIGWLCGMSRKRVIESIAELERIGVIKTQVDSDIPKGLANTTVTLLAEVRL